MGEFQKRDLGNLIAVGCLRLGSRSNLNENAIRNFEDGLRILPANDLAAIRAALEAAGVEFTNGDEPGARLRKEKA